MKPIIKNSEFGYILVENWKIDNDIIIRLSGKIKKRKKKLSKKVFGTSHLISREEAKYIYEMGAKKLIIGSGQQGMVTLSAEATEYFRKKHCAVVLLPTPQAINAWNKAEGSVIGLFHVTC